MLSLKDRTSTKCSLDLKINPDCIWLYKHTGWGVVCVCMVLFFFDLECWWGLFSTLSFSVFTVNSLTSCSNSKTTSTDTNTVGKPDPKKVLVAITRLCNNYKLLSFIQELQKGSGCETQCYTTSAVYIARGRNSNRFPAYKFGLSLQTCRKQRCVMRETYLL